MKEPGFYLRPRLVYYRDSAGQLSMITGPGIFPKKYRAVGDAERSTLVLAILSTVTPDEGLTARALELRIVSQRGHTRSLQGGSFHGHGAFVLYVSRRGEAWVGTAKELDASYSDTGFALSYGEYDDCPYARPISPIEVPLSLLATWSPHME